VQHVPNYGKCGFLQYLYYFQTTTDMSCDDTLCRLPGKSVEQPEAFDASAEDALASSGDARPHLARLPQMNEEMGVRVFLNTDRGSLSPMQ
jgi:hypothetical protein